MNNQPAFHSGFSARKLAVAGMLAASLYLCLLPVPTGAQIPVQEWVRIYNGYGGVQFASDIRVDTNGDVYVTGSSAARTDYASDYTTFKYSSAGLPLWTNSYRGPANAMTMASAMALDNEGNVIVTGGMRGVGSVSDWATIKYSSGGLPLWTNLYDGTEDHEGNGDAATAVVADSRGSVYVTGVSAGTSYSTWYTTIGYSRWGVPLWTNHYHGPSNSDRATGIALNSSGDVYVTGFSYGDDSYSDYTTIKYSSVGSPLWTNRYRGSANGNDQAKGIVVDASGNAFVTGYSTGDGTQSGSRHDYATVAYSGAGIPLWTNRYNGPGNGNDEAAAIAVNASGNVFVTGVSDRSSTNSDKREYATMGYSSAGVPLWTNRYIAWTNGGSIARALALGTDGTVYVAGSSANSDGSWDYVMLAYSGAGVPLWTNRYSSVANYRDNVTAIAVDSSDNVFVMGTSTYTTGSSDYATVKYAAAPKPSLRISTVGTEVRMAWPSSVNGWTLRRALVVEGPYADPALSVTLEGSDWVVYDAINGGARFYRLQKLP